MLAVQRAGPHPMRLSGKRAAAGALGTTPATEPIKSAQEQTLPHRIVSSATQQAIFVEGWVSGVLSQLLVDNRFCRHHCSSPVMGTGTVEPKSLTQVAAAHWRSGCYSQRRSTINFVSNQVQDQSSWNRFHSWGPCGQ